MKNRGRKPPDRPHRLEKGESPGTLRAIAILRMFLLFPFLASGPLAVQAQTVYDFAHGDWEVSVFGGGSFLGSGVYATPASGPGQPSSRAVGLRYGSGYQMGARISDNRWQHWGTTFEYGFSNQPISFSNLSDSTPSLGLGHSIHRFSYGVNYYFRDKYSRWRPFAFAGPGVTLFYIKGSAKDAAAAQGIQLSDPWKFTVNWGGGMKYLVVRQVAGSFQFSDSISGVPGYGLPKTGTVVSGAYVPGFRPEGYLHNWLISLGFIFQWDE